MHWSWNKIQHRSLLCCYFSLSLCGVQQNLQLERSQTACETHKYKYSISRSIFVPAASHVSPRDYKSNARRLNQSSDAWKLIIKYHPLANTQRSINQLRHVHLETMCREGKNNNLLFVAHHVPKPMRLLVPTIISAYTKKPQVVAKVQNYKVNNIRGI